MNNSELTGHHLIPVSLDTALESLSEEQVSGQGKVTNFDMGHFLLTLMIKIVASNGLEDKDLDRFDEEMKKHDGAMECFTHYLINDQHVPSAYWRILLINSLYHWSEVSSDSLDNQMLVMELDVAFSAHLSLHAIYQILKIVKDIEDNGNTADKAQFIHIIHCANLFASEFPEEAHDLFSFGFAYLSPLTDLRDDGALGEYLLKSASNFVKLAMDGGKKHQLASASVAMAEAYALCAKSDRQYRKDALRATELACERFDWCEPPLDAILANKLQTLLKDQDYLKTTGRRLFPYFDKSTVDEYKKVANLRRLMPTVDAPAQEDNENSHDVANWLFDVQGQSRVDAPLDDELIEKSERNVKGNFSFNLHSDWRVNHEAYLNSIPHNRSFFREKHFQKNLTALIHELTHLLCQRGGVGYAMVSFRAAMVMWEINLISKQQDIQAKLDRDIIEPAKIENSSIHNIPLVASQLACAVKIQILHQVWTPVLEGIAMFAELDALPTDDEEESAILHQVLSGLTDQIKWGETIEEIQDNYLTYIVDYEQKATEAIKTRRSASLREGLTHTNEAYWSGYLTIRAIFRRWQETSKGRATVLPGKALKLLMLAYTKGTLHFVPDLSLPIDAFRKACEASMHSWCKSVSMLDAESIAKGTNAVSTGNDLIWRLDNEGGAKVDIVELTSQSDHQQDVADQIDNIIQQVWKPHSFDLDSEEQGYIYETKFLSTIFNDVMADYYQQGLEKYKQTLSVISESLILQLLQFEIGMNSSRFYLKPIQDRGDGYLFVSLRTTDEHIETGDPSYNGLMFLLSEEEFQRLTHLYETYRIPRIEVRRLVDMVETVAPKGIFPHFLVFSYGHGDDVLHIIRGASQAGNYFLKESPDGAEVLEALFSTKITPNSLSAMDLKLADGKLIAHRTLEWLSNSSKWLVNGLDYSESVSAFSEQLTTMANALLDEEIQKQEINVLARRLAAESIGFPDQGPQTNTNSFKAGLVQASIFKTAREIIEWKCRPDSDEELSALKAQLDSLNITLFSDTENGIDVVCYGQRSTPE